MTSSSEDLIVEMRFGSHLYGTATAQSDVDIKAVYLPAGRDILLQRVRDTVTEGPDKPAGTQNAPGAVDRERFSLQRYLALLAAGQTMALDMLFAPDSAMTRQPSALWLEIRDNAPLLVSRRASAFLRYCRQQANKYGIKGSRVAAARQALAVLAAAEAQYGTTARLAAAGAELEILRRTSAHMVIIDVPSLSTRLIRHFEVCGKKMPFTGSIKSAREMAQRLVDEYGERSLQAERNEGIDWKALSHAVRVAREALELYETGRITFPLACAVEISAIRRGDMTYEAVAARIERLLVEVEAAALRSTLRAEPDFGFIDDLVARAYRERVMGTQ